MTQDPFDALREQMVQVIAIYAHYSSEKLGKDAFDERVMEVLGEVFRHEFVPLELRAYAYADGPLPIGYEKTISQPFMVALMTDLAETAPLILLADLEAGHLLQHVERGIRLEACEIRRRIDMLVGAVGLDDYRPIGRWSIAARILRVGNVRGRCSQQGCKAGARQNATGSTNDLSPSTPPLATEVGQGDFRLQP